MILAAISFSDPLMLVGLLAAAIPVALHLLNRIRSPIVPFPTLRFLKITAQKTSRRRQVQQYFLLLLRMAVFAMIAMAVAHPLIRGGSSMLAYGFILMLLVGLGLLVAALVFGSAAMSKSAPPTEAKTAASSVPQPSQKKYWPLSAAAFLLAIALAGYATFGLTSGVYFSGDTGEFSGRSTALALILDDSHSMLARQDSATRLQHAKEQARAVLAETIKPAEAVLLATNPGLQPEPTALTSNLPSLIGSLDALTPIGRAKPMKERLQTAIRMLLASSQPNKILVVVSDFARPAFADAEVLAPFKDIPEASGIQLVLMPIGKGSPPADVGISSFAIAKGGGHAVVGSEIIFEAHIVNNSDAADVRDLALYVDDAPVEGVTPHVQLGPAGTGSATSTITIPYRLTQPGPHLFSLRLSGVQDAVDWNDRREVVLNVAQQIRVLVIGPESANKPRSRSAAFFFDAALAPFDGLSMKDGSGKPIIWSIEPTYRGAADIRDLSSLAGYSAVFLCDLPKLSAPLAAALPRYLQQNGRLIWILGPSVNAPAYNQALLTSGKELLPAPLDQPLVSATGQTIDWVDLRSDIFANLFDNQDPFRAAVITGRWSLAGNTIQRGRILSKLADGSPLIVQQDGPGGTGEIYTVLTTPSAAWSNLGATVLLVPLSSRMALGDSGRFRTDTSYEPNDNIELHVSDTAKIAAVPLDITLPDKSVLNIRPIVAAEIPHWYFDRTAQSGLYNWRSTDQKLAGMFVVNPPSDEVELFATDTDALARQAATVRPAIVAATAPELLALLAKQSEGSSLAPGVLAIVLMLAVLEALLANRYRPSALTRHVENSSPAPIPETVAV